MNFSKFRVKDDGYSFSKMKDEFESKKSVERKSTNVRKEFPDRNSEGTQKTKQSKASKKSVKSTSTNEKGDLGTRGRDTFEEEKNVHIYAQEKKIESLEVDFEYKTDEESLFNSFENDVKRIPMEIIKRFTLNESSSSKKIVRDVLRRFVEKSQTFEFMIEFNSTVEKTDESSIT